MLTNFIYAKSKAMFEERIADVPNDAIVFIEDTKEIWTHGTYFDCSTLDPNIIPNLQTEIAELRANVNDKADTNGIYPDMTVGTAEMAETLGGRPFINNAEFTFRATADKDNSVTDGMATITKLMGNSVVWNQLLEKSYFSEDRAMATREGTAMISGHKYLLKRTKTQGGCYILVKPDFYDYSLRDNESYIFFSNSENCVSNGTFPTYPHVYCTAESGYVQLIDLTKMFGQGNEPTTIEEYNKRKPIVADEYVYNEGQLVHMNATGIKSVGDNAWDEEWEIGSITADGEPTTASNAICSRNYIKVLPNVAYYANKALRVFYYDSEYNFLSHEAVTSNEFTTPSSCAYIKFLLTNTAVYNNDIIISLIHTGWKQDVDAGYQPYWEDRLMFDERIREAFLNGMQKWDMVYNKNGKGYIIKGTGVADLGSLSWIDDTFNGVPTFTTKDVTNGVMRSVYGSLGDSIIALYSEMIEFGHLATSDNKVFVFNSSAHASNTLAVRDTAYTNASEFKSAMNGVMLYYQLAEPTIIEYDEPFNFSYRIADFGTEEIISNTLSAPLRTKIEYGFNAYDTIITNKLSIRELLTKTNYTIKNLSIGNEGQNKINIFQDEESNELFIQTLEGVVISTRNSTTTISDTGIVTNGSVSATNGFFQTSDANLKNFSDPISVDLEKLSTLKKHYFTWKNGGDQQIGVCAQEIQELYPEIVNQSNDGTLSVDYTKLSVIALKAIDVLNDKNKEIESRLEKLEKLLNNE